MLTGAMVVLSCVRSCPSFEAVLAAHTLVRQRMSDILSVGGCGSRKAWSWLWDFLALYLDLWGVHAFAVS